MWIKDREHDEIDRFFQNRFKRKPSVVVALEEVHIWCGGSVCHVVETNKLMWLLCGSSSQQGMFRSGQKQIHKPYSLPEMWKFSVWLSMNQTNTYMTYKGRMVLNKRFLNKLSFPLIYMFN